MSRYLALLHEVEEKIETQGGMTLQNLQNPVGRGSVGFVGASSPTLSEINGLAPCPVPDVQAVKPQEELNDGDAGGTAVTNRQAAFLGRPPLVGEDELNGIQRALMRHLVDCRACNVSSHAYCRDGERIGLGYWAYLFEFPDGDDRHREYAKAVALARSAGLRAGFNALMRMYTSGGHNRLEARMGAAWLALDEHTASCTGCLRQAGRFCTEGRELHEAAMLEGMQ